MRITSFLASAEASACPKAIAPVVWQEQVNFRADDSLDGDGDVAVDLLAAIAAGGAVPYGGQVMNEGCCDVLLTLTYIDGQGCDPCAVDTLVTTDVTLTVRANTVVDLPKGFVQGITVLAVDGAGAAKVVTANQDISYNACLEPCCSGSVVAV